MKTTKRKSTSPDIEMKQDRKHREHHDNRSEERVKVMTVRLVAAFPTATAEAQGTGIYFQRVKENNCKYGIVYLAKSSFKKEDV